MPTAPASPTASPTPPDPADRSTFTARAVAWSTWVKDTHIGEMEALATNAYDNAVESAASADDSATSAGEAAGHASTAAGHVTAAEAARDDAEALAAAALLSPTTQGTASDSRTIGEGTLNLTTQTGKNFIVTQWVLVASRADPSNWMAGPIVSYTTGSGAIQISVTHKGGSGTYSDWNISPTAPLPSVINVRPEFGDGSDGDVTVSSGTTTLTRNMYYNNLTISGTGSIDAAGYKIFVLDTLDLTAAPADAIKRLVNDGGNSSGTGAGAAPSSTGHSTTNEVGAGGAGTAGASGDGVQATAVTDSSTYLGGRCGASGAGGADGDGGSPGGAARAKPTDVVAAIEMSLGQFIVAGIGTLAQGGLGGQGGSSGGGGGSSGGGGGGGGRGGGVLDIRAKTISRGASTAAGAISARGGDGGDGGNASTNNRGGGAGGSGAGGGLVQIVYRSLTGATATNAIDVSGGAGGNGGTGHNSGAAGAGGDGGDGGRFRYIDLKNGVVYDNLSSATGSAASGTSGGAGATARYSL